jgi:tetratricopeptide (TPR) repeat protein
MSKKTPANPDPARPLPERANLEHLKKEAKQRLKVMRLDNPGVKLSTVQLTVAREYGFSTWRSLIAYVKSQPDREAQLRDQRPGARGGPFRLTLQAFKDGVAAAGKGDYQTAVAHFRQAETGHPAITLSLVEHAVTKEFGEGVWRDLLAYVKSLPDEAQLRPTDSDLSPAYDDGLKAVGRGDYQTAVAHLRRAIRGRPLRTRAHYYLGRALFRLQLHREAFAAFEELLKFDPENLLAHYEIGKLHLYARNYPQEFRKAKATLIDDQHEPRKPATILYKMMPEYTEIARINRLEGAVVIGADFSAEGFISGIRVARGLPDGLTWRAVLAARTVRFDPASINGAPVRTREFIEFNFNLH